jgi:Delta3-Delta2-enoyl-CoA isomerase
LRTRWPRGVINHPRRDFLTNGAASRRGEIWSNGLDLEWLGQNQDRVQVFVDQVHELLASLLAAPLPTVAAIQGHCFAAGAMLALAHDWRVMRADRGYFLPAGGRDQHPVHARDVGAHPGASAAGGGDGRHGWSKALRWRRGGSGRDRRCRRRRGSPGRAERRVGRGARGQARGTLATITQRMYEPVLARLRDTEANRLFPAT